MNPLIYSIRKIIIVLIVNIIISQNTILFSPFISYPEYDEIFTTYLISEHNNILHLWNHDCSISSTPYLTNDNILVRPCEVEFPSIDLPGRGGRIQKINWLGEILWDFIYSWIRVFFTRNK